MSFIKGIEKQPSLLSVLSFSIWSGMNHKKISKEVRNDTLVKSMETLQTMREILIFLKAHQHPLADEFEQCLLGQEEHIREQFTRDTNAK